MPETRPPEAVEFKNPSRNGGPRTIVILVPRGLPEMDFGVNSVSEMVLDSQDKLYRKAHVGFVRGFIVVCRNLGLMIKWLLPRSDRTESRLWSTCHNLAPDFSNVGSAIT